MLTELRNVVNITTLSMTDKERMDVVERCHSKMKRYRNLVSYYTNKNISVSYLRAKKKNDLDRIMGLYGNMAPGRGVFLSASPRLSANCGRQQEFFRFHQSVFPP